MYSEGSAGAYRCLQGRAYMHEDCMHTRLYTHALLLEANMPNRSREEVVFTAGHIWDVEGLEPGCQDMWQKQNLHEDMFIKSY